MKKELRTKLFGDGFVPEIEGDVYATERWLVFLKFLLPVLNISFSSPYISEVFVFVSYIRLLFPFSHNQNLAAENYRSI